MFKKIIFIKSHDMFKYVQYVHILDLILVVIKFI
jgi:hypothetical protein